MQRKHVVIVGAGPCGLVALKELREAGHTAVALEKGPGIGGVFCRTHDTQYENLYLTISNMLMAYSDFPPEDLRLKYSSKDEYGAYLEAYADAFGLRPHVRTDTEVVRASLVDGRWRIVARTGGGAPEEIEADALVVATGSNHVPRVPDLPGFTGEVLHSSEYRCAADFAGKRVLVVGSGESAFDIGADIAGVAAKTTLWARTPITPAPRFAVLIAAERDHDEIEVMKNEAKWSRLKVSDFLESMTVSRMANAAPMWAYSTIRHAIWAALRLANPVSERLSAWNRQAVAPDLLLGDQLTVPTKSARLCTAAARGNIDVVVAAEASFSARRASFAGVTYEGHGPALRPAPREAAVDDLDVVVLCTGYRTDFSWLDVPGLDWNPRTWFKHCFPAGLGDRLMFLGWARPHQGGIPACAEILARYIAMVLTGDRALPGDYAERALAEGRAEHDFYKHARHQVNLVDYPAFMDSVARLIGCTPAVPPLSSPERLAQYWLYPNWPIWYRKDGPGARSELVERVLSTFPLRTSFGLNPFNLMALGFSALQAPVEALWSPRPGLDRRWAFKAKKHLLHDST